MNSINIMRANDSQVTIVQMIVNGQQVGWVGFEPDDLDKLIKNLQDARASIPIDAKK